MATVLIVDDEPDIVLFVRINLELAGHAVRTAGDGHEALVSVRADPPDVVVLDVMMPRIDGWSVLAEMKADPDETIRTIPVVMLTALSDEVDQVRGAIEGAVRYLAKPVTPEALVEAVEDVLAQGPEPVQRKAAQQRALGRLARMERGLGGPAETGGGPRLSRLERPRAATAAEPPRAARPAEPEPVLTGKQRELLVALQRSESVSAVAAELGVSRSNVYASLRRVGRKLGVSDVSELLRRLRAGELAGTLDG
jgi:CheY-like chemotaxis protein/DNA-binding CsgD family transcriptional regulator